MCCYVPFHIPRSFHLYLHCCLKLALCLWRVHWHVGDALKPAYITEIWVVLSFPSVCLIIYVHWHTRSFRNRSFFIDQPVVASSKHWFTHEKCFTSNIFLQANLIFVVPMCNQRGLSANYDSWPSKDSRRSGQYLWLSVCCSTLYFVLLPLGQ